MALARALVVEPELLLLDEPFAALDQPTRESLIQDLRGVLRADRVTAVLVTHHRGEALALGDRLAVLIGGRILQMGPAAQVFQRPDSEDVARFVGRRDHPRRPCPRAPGRRRSAGGDGWPDGGGGGAPASRASASCSRSAPRTCVSRARGVSGRRQPPDRPRRPSGARPAPCPGRGGLRIPGGGRRFASNRLGSVPCSGPAGDGIVRAGFAACASTSRYSPLRCAGALTLPRAWGYNGLNRPRSTLPRGGHICRRRKR